MRSPRNSPPRGRRANGGPRETSCAGRDEPGEPSELLGLLQQHDGNVVPYREAEPALRARQCLGLRIVFEVTVAAGAYQDTQQVWTQSHGVLRVPEFKNRLP